MYHKNPKLELKLANETLEVYQKVVLTKPTGVERYTFSLSS